MEEALDLSFDRLRMMMMMIMMVVTDRGGGHYIFDAIFISWSIKEVIGGTVEL